MVDFWSTSPVLDAIAYLGRAVAFKAAVRRGNVLISMDCLGLFSRIILLSKA